MTARKPGLLFIVNSLAVGGAEKQVVTLLNHLDTRRFRLHLAYLKRREELLPLLRTDKLDALVCCDVERRIDREAVERLRQLIRTRDIDAIVCTNMYSMLYGHLARGSGRDAPRMVTAFHTTILRGYRNWAQMLLYRPLFKRCDLLIYVCENQRTYWRERGLRAGADAVVHNGIDVDFYSDRSSVEQKRRLRESMGFGPDDYVVGLCSHLRPEKAHGDLLQAIAKLRAQGIPAKAMLIGDGPERPVIERTIEELGLQEHARITGLQQDVRPFIASCDVMTLVSRSETFSLAALESMALGRPIVMSDVSGASEQVVHGREGLLYEPGDIDELVLQLTMLTSGPLRTQMGSAAARRVRELFSVHAMTNGFTRTLLDLLRAQPARSARSA